MERWGIPALDLPGSRIFILALLIQSVGNGLFVSFVLIYFHKVAGIALADVGLAITIASGIGLVANPVAGQIVDRAGAKNMVSVSQVVQAAGYASFFLVHSFTGVIVVTLITMFGERIFWVAFPTLVAAISPPDERDRWYAFTSAVRNAGLGAGGLVAGVVVWLAGQSGYHLLLGADVAGFALAASILILRVPPIGGRPRAMDHGGYREVVRDRPAMTVTGANVIFAYCAMLIFFAMPVYVVDTLDQPAWMVGLLFALNTALLALGQTLAVDLVGNWRRTRVLAVAGIIWVTASALFACALAIPDALLPPYLALVVILYTLGELIHAPTSTSLVASLAPDALRGRYLAMISLSWGIAQTIGPALFTGLLAWSGVAPWAVTAVIAAGGALLVLTAEPFISAEVLRPRARSAA
jgi:MFS family permease